MKKIKFLIDVGVGSKVEKFLQKKGYDVLRVRDIDPRSKDDEILKIAAKDHRMVITMDKDFGELVYHSGLPHAGVFLLRLEDATGSEKASVIADILDRHEKEMDGRFCVYRKGIIRIR